VVSKAMRILFCGDFHANWTNVHRMLDYSLDGTIDLVVQVGDFGYWPDTLNEMNRIETLLDDRDTHLLFVDGNHEDHEALQKLKPAPIDMEVFGPLSMEVSNHIHWMPRGTIVKFDRLTMGFFGGASSLDRQWRTPGYDWFGTEMPTPYDLENLADNVEIFGTPDVMISHEVPIIAGPRYDEGHHGAMFPKVDREIADSLRKGIMMEAYNIAQPDVWFYGHHHQQMIEYNIGPHGTDFYGLGMDMQPDAKWVHAHDFPTGPISAPGMK